MASSILLWSSPSLLPKFLKGRTDSTQALLFFSRQKPPKSHNLRKPPTLSTPIRTNTLLGFRSEIRVVGGTETKDSLDCGDAPIGEDSAVFKLRDQKVASWAYFTLILGFVLFALDYLWINPTTGYETSFIRTVSSISESPEAYFIDHRYDGIQLWHVQSAPFVHEFVWLLSFISFFFLYPSTFNLLEVAAVDKPKMHLWETGIMRITRHPQMVGQVLWCLAHTIWVGNSVVVAASMGLILHHLFGVWNGDRRLAVRYGEAFDAMKSRTSVVPFAAIIDGRQRMPKDYYKEFLRLPYLTITALTLGAYCAHPLMQASSIALQRPA